MDEYTTFDISDWEPMDISLRGSKTKFHGKRFIKKYAPYIYKRRFFNEKLFIQALENAHTHEFYGLSKDFIEMIMYQIPVAASSKDHVLIIGETGTGKELVAKMIAEKYHGAKKKAETINCAGFPDTLIESELFGYVKGAFNNAETERKGLFGTANGGSIFFDELDKMPIAQQSKLLRVLEEGEYRMLGSDVAKHTLFKGIFAMSKDPFTLMEENRLLKDLYFRISANEIVLKPLRERMHEKKFGNGDIEEYEDTQYLAEYFILKFMAEKKIVRLEMTEGVYQKLSFTKYEGNVRELMYVAKRIVDFCYYSYRELISFFAEYPNDKRLPKGAKLNEFDLSGTVFRQNIIGENRYRAFVNSLIRVSKKKAIEKPVKANIKSEDEIFLKLTDAREVTSVLVWRLYTQQPRVTKVAKATGLTRGTVTSYLKGAEAIIERERAITP